MQCPVDGAQLVMTERSGVEIDYCPQCRGVWLDRGELDKIIDRATPAVTLQEPPRHAAPQPPAYGGPSHQGGHMGGDYRGGHGRDDDYYKKKKRGSLLGDIFDF